MLIKSFPFQFIITTAFIFITSACSKTGAETNPSTSTIPPPLSDTVINPKKWMVSTFAGSGEKGFADGKDTSSKFHGPMGVAFDKQGNLFVADIFNTSIRKITPDANVTTYAGKTVYQTPGMEFGNITSVAFGQNNELYAIDGNFIRLITTPTITSMFAGSNKVYFNDGQGTEASFNIINQLATDKQGNIFVPDFDMNNKFRIRKINPQGTVTTLKLIDDTAFPSDASSNGGHLSTIAVDNSGNLYVTANGNCLIKKINAEGKVSLFAGAGNIGFTDGKGSLAQFNTIAGLAVDSIGNVYVSDYGNNAIRLITADGVVTTIAGGTQGFRDGEGLVAQFYYPYGIAVDKKGAVYVADWLNNRIRKIELK